MNPVKPVFEDIARARGEVALSIYFEPRNYSNPAEMQTEQARLRTQMESFQHPSLVGKEVKPEESVLRLNSPDSVQQVLGQVSQGYKGMVHDVFLTNDQGQPVGRARDLYDFLERIDPMQGLLIFYQEIAGTKIVPKQIRQKVTEFVKFEGTTRLKEQKLDDKIAEWEAIFA